MYQSVTSSSSLYFVAILSFAILCSLNVSGNVNLLKICPSPGGTVQAVQVSSCTNNATVCPLKHNTNVTLDLDFTTKKMARKVTISIFGFIKGIPVPFPVSPSNACDNTHNLKCPLKPGQPNHFRLNLPISSVYPLLPVTVNVNLLDGTKTNIACIKFDAKIVK